ncbi:MAG: class I SAM-dependent methyltransferase [Cyanobacteria bacterium P01_D01_bin.105]
MSAIASSVINGLLSIKPLAKFAKSRARTMMMDRAEDLGVHWREEVKTLAERGGWEEDLKAIANPNITYPDYYTTSFHAYDEGNLGWLPAMEVDVAARAVHARIWSDDRGGINGDASLRESYHQKLREMLPAAPERIVDLGCGAGRSTVTLQETFPEAALTGIDLSPYFVTVAKHLAPQMTQDMAQATEAKETPSIHWIHAAAEETGLSVESVDLVSVCLVFHELPTAAAHHIIAEAYRILRPSGHLAIMDMNPQCDTFVKMPPYVLTLLKSTEPYLDQYFSLDMAEAFQRAGFDTPKIVTNSPRHRTIVGQKKA